MAQKHLSDMEERMVSGIGEDTGQDKEEIQEEGLPVVPLNKRKLLIIEDDTDVREFLKEERSV